MGILKAINDSSFASNGILQPQSPEGAYRPQAGVQTPAKDGRNISPEGPTE